MLYLKIIKAVAELVPIIKATATAGSPCHPVLKYRTSLVTPLATVVAIAVAANLDTALHVNKSIHSLTLDYNQTKTTHTHYQNIQQKNLSRNSFVQNCL